MCELSPVERRDRTLIGLKDRSDNAALTSYQLKKIKEAALFAREKSVFYRELYRGVSLKGLSSLEDVAALPFVTAEDVISHGREMLTLSPHEIERIVTMNTSGSEGESKRICFTGQDIEETLDFFAAGMTAVANKEDRILVLLPDRTDYSVGSVAARGFRRGGLQADTYGHIESYEDAADAIGKSGANVLVGLPAQILSLAKTAPELAIRSVLLAADYIPDSLASSIESIWGAKVFRHYGTTETGYGGGVECAARNGYHMRHADIYFEIVRPDTGEKLPFGEYGEIVFTALDRIGMPLIRYRMGDIGCMTDEPCPCGGIFPRLLDVGGRLKDTVTVGGVTLSVRILDELLFSFPEVMDYTSTLRTGGKPELLLAIKAKDSRFDAGAIGERLAPVLGEGITLTLTPGEGFQTNSVKKRRILIEN